MLIATPVLLLSICLVDGMAQSGMPGKLLFKDIYFPSLVDSGKHIAFFKYIEKGKTSISRLCVGDPETGQETTLFPDIDFNRDKVQAYAFMPDGKKIALVDKTITLCDIWLHDRENPLLEPVRLTELDQFDPGYSTDQLYQLGMNPKGVMEVKQFDISPDGKKVAMTFGILGKTAVWLFDIELNHYRQMTPDRVGYLPKWFPDSKRFVYTVSDSTSGRFSEDMRTMDAGTLSHAPLVTSKLSESWATPSPDGKYVAYTELEGSGWHPCVVRVSDGKHVRIMTMPEGKSCGTAMLNGDSTKLYLVLGGYESNFPDLFEIPFDPKVFDK
jgi:Tol biopolymer transport system component